MLLEDFLDTWMKELGYEWTGENPQDSLKGLQICTKQKAIAILEYLEKGKVVYKKDTADKAVAEEYREKFYKNSVPHVQNLFKHGDVVRATEGDFFEEDYGVVLATEDDFCLVKISYALEGIYHTPKIHYKHLIKVGEDVENTR